MNQEIITVSQLNQQIRLMLETRYAHIAVLGELSNVSKPSSGHLYFTLKDENAQVKCAMFRTQAQKNSYQPQNGDQVVITARASLYDQRGDYQLIVQQISAYGAGQLQQNYEKLRDKLFNEGLFDPSYKKPITAAEHCLALITSKTGAALQDMLNILQRRAPHLTVLLYPVAVQGEQAAPQICQALKTANRNASIELIIVGRGGGSLEDLWAFNEESVARAIFASQIPVVSAVGHETDVTIADFIADLRAPTPSAAAELCSSNIKEQFLRLSRLSRDLKHRFTANLTKKKTHLKHVEHRLQDPRKHLQQLAMRTDDLERRLQQGMHQILQAKKHKLSLLQANHQHNSPAYKLKAQSAQLVQLNLRLRKSANQNLEHQHEKLAHYAAMLQAYSPLKTISRGYLIAENKEGSVIHSITQLAPDDEIELRLKDGKAIATITSLTPQKNDADLDR